MTDSLFRSGTLELPLSPPGAEPVQISWIDTGLNRILILVTIVLTLALFKSLVRITPHIIQSLNRSRGCLNLEHSFSMANLRNVCALAATLPFCLIADRYSFIPFIFGWNLPEWAGTLAVLCVLAAYYLARRFMFFLICPGSMDYDSSNALAKTMLSFFIVLNVVMLISLAGVLLLNLDDDSCRIVFMAEMLVFYLFSLIRSAQFLSAYCNGFATFLYLCALELIPLATVAVTGMYLRL